MWADGVVGGIEKRKRRCDGRGAGTLKGIAMSKFMTRWIVGLLALFGSVFAQANTRVNCDKPDVCTCKMSVTITPSGPCPGNDTEYKVNIKVTCGKTTVENECFVCGVSQATCSVVVDGQVFSATPSQAVGGSWGDTFEKGRCKGLTYSCT
jgi:hypothetical protein